ncbi:MAG: hypothetical protein F9K29_05495 [Hyphomicrobiaceae bacterium]|nr:MAG: hypothetical protein F9K29_05495 [Hyphomicrobiaceae bacterium]
MAILGSGLFGQLKPGKSGGRLLGGSKAKVGRAMLRGRSKRAYSFEVYPRDVVSALWEAGAVYCYARTVPAGSPDSTGKDANGAGYEIGYVGRTDNMSRQDAEHQSLGHFDGHGFDAVLVLRIEQEPIRVDVERDLIELHNPVLNDLLRGYKPDSVS